VTLAPARLAALALVLAAAATGRADDVDTFHATPSVYAQLGDQRIDLNVAVRSRIESWDAFARDADSFVGTRTRLRLSYSWRDQLFLVGEVQDVRLTSMDPDGTGALATYRNAADGQSNAHGTDVHLLWAEFRPTTETFFRVGRQDLRLGPEVNYEEADWRYLKSYRLGERLIGSVGFSHEERAADGLTAGWSLGGHNVFLFAAQPTTGVFEVQGAYKNFNDISYEGGEWTVKRGTWLPDTELASFVIAYQDRRPPKDAGLAHGISLATFGGSLLGVYPLGPGKLDVLFWGAGQLGSYDRLDQGAWALIGELGYHLPDLPLQPWLRAGVNAASGDSNPNDGDHGTFFNLLPTNHIYYGFADQLAFANLVNPFVQLRLSPHPMVALNLFAHWFRLEDSADARYAGTGAYNDDTFGFTAQPSRGFTHVGREYDVVATVTPLKALTLEAGFNWLAGGALFSTSPSHNLRFGYLMAELRY